MKTKTTINILAFGVLLTASGCVTGPPVESQAERRVERSLAHANDPRPEERGVVYYEGYREGAYDGYPYYKTRTTRGDTGPYYQGYRETYHEEYVTPAHPGHDARGRTVNDANGNYDQEHDRFYLSK